MLDAELLSDFIAMKKLKSICDVEQSVLMLFVPSLPSSVVSDMVLYVADIAYSLRCFMEVYPPSVSLAVDCGLLERCVCVCARVHVRACVCVCVCE